MDEFIKGTYFILLPIDVFRYDIVLKLPYLDIITNHKYITNNQQFWQRKVAYELGNEYISKSCLQYDYVKELALNNVAVIGNNYVQGAEVIMCPVQMVNIYSKIYLDNKNSINKQNLYFCLDMFIDLVNKQDIIDISGFNYLYNNFMIDELLYILPKLHENPEFTINVGLWLFEGKHEEFDRLVSILNTDDKHNFIIAKKYYLLITSEQDFESTFDLYCTAYKYGYKKYFNYIRQSLQTKTNIEDQIELYISLNMEKEVLDLFSNLSVQRNIDIYCYIFKNQNDNLELIKKLYNLIDKNIYQQYFIRGALQHMDSKSKVFNYFIDLFDPNYIKNLIDINIIIFKSYTDLQGLYRIKNKIDMLINKDYIITNLNKAINIGGLYAGYYPALKECFNLNIYN